MDLPTFASFPWILRLAPDVTVEAREGSAVLRAATGELSLNARFAGLPGVIAALGGEGGTEAHLLEIYKSAADEEGAAPFFYLLGRLEQLGLLCRALEWRGDPFLISRPTRAPRGPAGAMPERTSRYRLSRFALIRREGAELLLESPAAWSIGILTSRLLPSILHDLAKSVRCDELSRRSPELAADILGPALALLHRAGLLCRADGDAPFEEDTAPGPALWAFHDLLFHDRTRQGGRREPLGKTYPFLDRCAPTPVLRVSHGLARIELPRPDLARMITEDPPFASVTEARRSTRRHGETPITRAALGELLFRTLRVRASSAPRPEMPNGSSDRPYPGAGACYPLEAYLAVDRCDGLAPGLYRYAPDEHALDRVCERTAGVEALLLDASRAAGIPALPHVLMILTARFSRVSWSYGPLAYNLILKDVGVVFHSVCLAAGAMNLACCPLGVGDAHLFAEVAGTDYLTETSVGEVILGTFPGF